MAFYNRSGNEITIAINTYYPFSNKKFCFIGDSFSSPNKWQNTMCEKLQAVNIYNAAIGGARWSRNDSASNTHAYAQAQNIVSKGYKPDVIMICLGCNDAGNSVKLGEIALNNSINNFDITTFSGGMQTTLNYLQNNFPNAIIYVGWTPAGGNCNWSAPTVVNPYIERMKEICLLYGIEYIETRTCGITKYSDVYADLWESGTSGGHPQDSGKIKIGNALANIITSKV